LPKNATPVVVETSAVELWRWPSAQATPLEGLVDDAAIYWYEDSGAIWRFVKGGSAAELLRAAQLPPVSVTGFVLDAERLYWGEAALSVGFQAMQVPPGTLLAADKTGANTRVVAELPDEIIFPVGVDAERVLGKLGSREGRYAQVALADGQLSPLESVPDGATLVDDRFYWLEPADDGHNTLWHARLGDPAPRSLGVIEGNSFDIGPSYVLWRRERYDSGPPRVLYQNFMLLDERRACRQPLPAAGESISFGAALDAEHVYWHSVNLVAGSPDYSDGRPSPALPDSPLYRLQIENGQVDELRTPGFTAPSGSFILAHDATHLYVATPEALVSIQKP
jgi:hypothetical protein